MSIKIKKLHPSAELPTFATPGAACFDIKTVAPGEVGACGGTHSFPTGLAFEIPQGHVMLVFSRSGHGFKNSITLVNCVGVIDSDYRGELMVKLRNDSALRFSFEPGDRIAQAMIVQLPSVQFVAVEELSDTQRGAGGFGSTGK